MCLPVTSEVSQSCPTLCDPMDCSLPGSFIHGIFQARVLEWVATAFSRGSSCFSSVQFSRSVVSDSLRPHESQHARPPCPSPAPRVHPDSRSSSQWCHPAISSSAVPFSSCPQSLPAWESFPMSQLFAWGGQSTGVSASASFLPKKSQGWSPSEWTGWIFWQSKAAILGSCRNYICELSRGQGFSFLALLTLWAGQSCYCVAGGRAISCNIGYLWQTHCSILAWKIPWTVIHGGLRDSDKTERLSTHAPAFAYSMPVSLPFWDATAENIFQTPSSDTRTVRNSHRHPNVLFLVALIKSRWRLLPASCSFLKTVCGDAVMDVPFRGFSHVSAPWRSHLVAVN